MLAHPHQDPEPPPGDGGAVGEVTEALFSFDFSLEVLAYNLSALLAAFVLALPVAWDREQRRSSPGLRTFPLVAIPGHLALAQALQVERERRLTCCWRRR